MNRIRDAGGVDIHVIGFSLGAQLANYVAVSLKPSYQLPRITGQSILRITGGRELNFPPNNAISNLMIKFIPQA